MFIFACSSVGTIFAIAEPLQWLQYCGDAFTKKNIVVAMSESRKFSSTQVVNVLTIFL